MKKSAGKRGIMNSSSNTITGMLDRHVTNNPNHSAVIYEGEHTSFAELDALGRRVAQALAKSGIGAGDRVAIWLPNTTAFLVVYLACTRLSAIAVAVNTRFRAVEVADILYRSGAKVLAVWPGFRNIDFPGILNSIDQRALALLEHVIYYSEEETGMQLPESLPQCNRLDYKDLVDPGMEAMSKDLASSDAGSNIFTTSGTTKAPKFVLHTQQDITDHARDVCSHLGEIVKGGSLLQALPLCGVFGFTQAMMGLYAGRPSIMMSAFEAREAISLMDRHNVQYLNATDDMILSLLNADSRSSALPGVACCGFGAFNSDPEVVTRKADSRGLKLVGLYGMSEVQAMFAMQPLDAPIEKRMLGGGDLVSPAASVRVRNIETGDIQPHGEQGELEIRGPSMMKEYFNDARATENTMTLDGYVRTGDMGYTTSERSFVYLTRMGDALRLGGFLVSPAEIEALIQSYDSVSGCQVVAINIEEKVRAVAFVTVAENKAFSERAIIEHCRQGLAGYKVPARVFVLNEFPVTRSANGTKIQRARLREWAEAQVNER